jgi:putative transcriptional regulator
VSKSAFERLRAGLLEAKDYIEGKPTRVRQTHIAVTNEDMRAVRRQLKLTQSEFAPLVGMSVSGLRKIEQGQRRVQGALATLVHVMRREPEAVLRAIGRPARSSSPSEARRRA